MFAYPFRRYIKLCSITCGVSNNLWCSLHTWVGMKLSGCTREKNVLQDFINVSVAHTCSGTRAETFGFSADAKRQRRDVGHSPLSSVKLRNEWRYNSIPSHAFTSWYLIKHSDNFTCTRPINMSYQMTSVK
jgi:hypothetical protein